MVDLSEILSSYDWEECFGEGSGGNCDGTVESHDGTPCDPVTRADIVEVIAAFNGENDAADWCGVFLLKDGRYVAVVGGCDYTGWDCRASNSITVGATQDAVVRMGLSVENRKQLGLCIED